MQLAPAASGSAFGHNSYVPKMQYAYDVNARNGLVSATLKINDINDSPIRGVRHGQSIICPVDTGACVVSATGGVISGYDMYGQFVRETVAAAGTSKIAFAQLLSAPADALWVNKFGLPYKYVGAASPAMAGATFTAPAADGDARGTFVLTVAPTGPQEVALAYMADLSNLMGDPYATRYDTDQPGSTALAVTATLVAATGAVVVTVPASTPAGVKTTVTFPDGTTKRGVAGTPLNHTLSPVWRSQYMDAIDAAAADRLIAVAFDGGWIKGVYADVTVS